MALLLILMYKKLAISLSFHEIGGLVVCGMFIFHNTLNRKWIAGISKRMFGRKLAARVRLGYVLDVLLLIAMALIALSGIMISRTVLLGISGDVAFWRPLHYFASAVALVLVGIHIGLHWSFIRTSFARVLRVPRLISRPLGIAVLTAVLAYGVYGIATSNFIEWISEPLLGEESAGGGLHRGQGGGGEDEAAAGPVAALGTVATYGSIVVVPAALTAATESALKRRKRQPKLSAQPA